MLSAARFSKTDTQLERGTGIIGTFERFESATGSFGQQYIIIDGMKYVTFFDLADRRLDGLPPGVQVEFEAKAGPTVLCHIPYIAEDLPSAVLVQVKGKP